jgi:hypothetical protein
MTPINFVSFLISLVLVDLHYSCIRIRNHTEGPSRLPGWLHQILFRPQPYQIRTGDGLQGPYPREEKWHYHSNQAGIMKLEADEAFRVRNRVIIGLAVLLVVVAGTLWHLTKILYQRWHF